jgi:rhamnulokinase
MPLKLLAIDLGAESGRITLGTLDGRKVSLEEVYRFPNEPVFLVKSLHWDILRLFYEIKKGIAISSNKFGKDISSLGIDTWGVDFCLLDEKDTILCNPYHYRDHITDGIMEEAFKVVSKEDIFKRTGVQFMQINTLFQLLAIKRKNPSLLNITKTILMMPDLFNFLLTGEKLTEFTMATTTQIYNPFERIWDKNLLEAFDLPIDIFQKVVPPGTIVGSLFSRVAQEVGLDEITVIAPATHDTASAVSVVPAKEADYAYISSGTWSVLGTEISHPIVNKFSLNLNFSNGGGIRSFLLLKNIMGLWLIQECRRSWEKRGEYFDYGQLTEIAQKTKPLGSLIDPDDIRFLNPIDMPSEVQKYCRESGQDVPQTKGEIIVCILQSIALKYRWVLEELEKIIGRDLPTIYIVGGGTRNTLLNQFTADATNRKVIAGPVEATTVGNIMSQAMALREISSLDEARELVSNSFHPQEYEPSNRWYWDDLYEKFKRLIKIRDSDRNISNPKEVIVRE